MLHYSLKTLKLCGKPLLSKKYLVLQFCAGVAAESCLLCWCNTITEHTNSNLICIIPDNIQWLHHFQSKIHSCCEMYVCLTQMNPSGMKYDNGMPRPANTKFSKPFRIWGNIKYNKLVWTHWQYDICFCTMTLFIIVQGLMFFHGCDINLMAQNWWQTKCCMDKETIYREEMRGGSNFSSHRLHLLLLSCMILQLLPT